MPKREVGILSRSVMALLAVCFMLAMPGYAADMVQIIAKVKPSVVGVGTFIKTRSPAFQLMGTGFVVGDGLHVVTNAHTYAKPLDSANLEVPMIIMSTVSGPQPREAQLIAIDKEHDLALLKFSGAALPALQIGDSATLREGQMLAYTGIPIGVILGFHPTTHRGMVSALVPVVLPGITSRQLTENIVARLRGGAYRVIQLDGTAYPGNSGSPLYDPESGVVVGIINAVYIQGGREKAVGLPSGITYAIPSSYIRELLQREKIPAP